MRMPGDSEQYRSLMTPRPRHTETKTPRPFEGTAEPEPYAGYTLLDTLGQRIGKVERIFANGWGEPEYVKVKLGLFGMRSVLIPVWRAEVDEERQSFMLE